MDLTNFGAENSKPQEINDENLNFEMNSIKKNFSKDEQERFLPWFLKYQITKFDDLIITKELEKVISFFEEYKQGKALLLYGMPGSGKTTTINLMGNHYGFEIFELNASDARNKKSIIESVGDVIKQKSLFQKDKLILIDEVDGVSGTKDRGGVAELTKIVKMSNYPVCFTANDKDSDKIKTLKKVSISVDFENHSYELLENLAKKIFKNENISFEEKDLKEFIDERNTIDIRGFINDLQASIYNSKFERDSNLEIRDYKKKIEILLNKIYFSYPEDSVKSTFNSDVNLDDLLLYLEENTPKIYEKISIIKAFNEICKADVFRGRILKWQYWRYLVYINFYLTYGVSNSKTKPNPIKEYKRNSRILMKWIYNNKVSGLSARTKIQKKKGDDEKFIEKLSKTYSRSTKRTRSDDIRYFSFIYKNNKEFKDSMNEKFDIDESVKKALTEI